MCLGWAGSGGRTRGPGEGGYQRAGGANIPRLAGQRKRFPQAFCFGHTDRDPSGCEQADWEGARIPAGGKSEGAWAPGRLRPATGGSRVRARGRPATTGTGRGVHAKGGPCRPSDHRGSHQPYPYAQGHWGPPGPQLPAQGTGTSAEPPTRGPPQERGTQPVCAGANAAVCGLWPPCQAGHAGPCRPACATAPCSITGPMATGGATRATASGRCLAARDGPACPRTPHSAGGPRGGRGGRGGERR